MTALRGAIIAPEAALSATAMASEAQLQPLVQHLDDASADCSITAAKQRRLITIRTAQRQ